MMLQTLSGALHVACKTARATTVERSLRSLAGCFPFGEDADADVDVDVEEEEEELLFTFLPPSFGGSCWANRCLVNRSQARLKSRGKQT